MKKVLVIAAFAAFTGSVFAQTAPATQTAKTATPAKKETAAPAKKAATPATPVAATPAPKHADKKSDHHKHTTEKKAATTADQK